MGDRERHRPSRHISLLTGHSRTPPRLAIDSLSLLRPGAPSSALGSPLARSSSSSSSITRGTASNPRASLFPDPSTPPPLRPIGARYGGRSPCALRKVDRLVLVDILLRCELAKVPVPSSIARPPAARRPRRRRRRLSAGGRQPMRHQLRRAAVEGASELGDRVVEKVKSCWQAHCEMASSLCRANASVLHRRARLRATARG